MTSSDVVRDGQPHHDSTKAVETARGLAEYGEIYLGIDFLLSAIGLGVRENDEQNRAQWSCLVDLLNKAVVHQAAEDAYEITSFLDRFNINPDDESRFEDDIQEHEYGNYSGVDQTRELEQSVLTDFDRTPNQRESALPSSSTSEARESASCCGTIDFEEQIGRPLLSKRKRFQRIQHRFKCRISQLFKLVSSDSDEPRGHSYANQRIRPRRPWWRRQRHDAVFSNQVEPSCGSDTCSHYTERRGNSSGVFAPWAVSGYDTSRQSGPSYASTSCSIMEASRNGPSIERSRASSSMTSSRAHAPCAIYEYGLPATSERSRALTSFVMMEKSMSASRLAEYRGAEASTTSSRGYAPWAVSEYDPQGVSERSRTGTSFAMMETTGSGSQLASTQEQAYSPRYSSGIVRFFGSFRFRAAT